ncbi:hypothetical protein D6D24_08685 [Aureobasidium pullulans]|uniref:BTB domain-containing protein n=1 Tax=Aureobasidium pullulans TaxID=5580 RepID=A0A4S8VCX5_AURPU|nr:hypothetical protein D6D24_08685 [Aureobasidium pullulans]
MSTVLLSSKSASGDQPQPQPKEEWKRRVWNITKMANLVSGSTAMVILLDEDEQNPFSVHKDLLCFYSPYHDRLLNGPFREAGSTRIKLPVTSLVLKLFSTWLYTGQIITPSTQDACSVNNPERRIQYDRHHTKLVDLYIFADSLNCIALERAAFVQLYKLVRLAKGPMQIFKLVDNGLEHSGLYKYWVDYWAAHYDSMILRILVDPLPSTFAHHLLLRKCELDLNPKTEACGTWRLNADQVFGNTCTDRNHDRQHEESSEGQDQNDA